MSRCWMRMRGEGLMWASHRKMVTAVNGLCTPWGYDRLAGGESAPLVACGSAWGPATHPVWARQPVRTVSTVDPDDLVSAILHDGAGPGGWEQLASDLAYGFLAVVCPIEGGVGRQ